MTKTGNLLKGALVQCNHSTMTKILEFITELLGWFQIVLSPLLIGLAIGGIIYFNKQDNIGLFFGIAVTVIGLIVGIVVATRIWKKRGTNNFLSIISSSPDLDNLDEINKDKK